MNKIRQNLAFSTYGFPLNELQLIITKANNEVKTPLIAVEAPTVYFSA